MLSKKYYEVFADLIGDMTVIAVFTRMHGYRAGQKLSFEFVQNFMNYLAEDNPNFDEDRFAAAVNDRIESQTFLIKKKSLAKGLDKFHSKLNESCQDKDRLRQDAELDEVFELLD